MINVKLYRCGNEKSISEYSIGLGYLKSNCINANISIVKSQNELVNCDLIGLSSDASGTKEAINILENSKIPIVVGGPIVLWKPLHEYPFKYIVHGDGELPLQRIINGTDKRFFNEQFEDIDFYKPPERGFCGKTIPIITSRGCSFSCNFCSSKAFWGKVRYHSADYFIREVLDILKKYPQAKELYILDDLFIGHKQRFQEIYEKWMKLELNKKLVLKSFVRSNILTLEVAQQMKDMGFKKIRFGGESGSDRILKILNKGATIEDHQRAIDIANKIRLPISASFMYDLPEETEEDLQLTKDFINKNKGKLQVEGWYKYQVFPGIKFYNNESPLEIDMKVR